MANTALDKPKDGRPAHIYHGGRELLAMSLRSDKGSMDTRYRAVKRAVAELSEAGAIKHLRSGWAGQNAVYRLTLGSTDAVDDDDSPDVMGGLIGPPVGGLTDPPNGGPVNAHKGGSTGPPKEHEDEILELQEEKSEVELTTTSHPPRATGNVIPILRTSRAQEALDAAAARVAKRKAEHRASQTPQSTEEIS
jgi:hypothetical protein